ncbi:MAG TPA: hypothetical protein VLZ05_22590 [Mycobacterium sp.]|nr:hypothetical protein [Mycobacterium sp.]HUH71423.1 hypothetical protein [Mycobacterium sp.]
MRDFRMAVMHLDEQALQYHLERGDFSRWLDGTIADKELATPAAVWEDQLLARSRHATNSVKPWGNGTYTHTTTTDNHARLTCHAAAEQRR